ncbi:hypothetical protein A4X13_0g6447 [Tilletia indica]|uniref:Uncharacterized protein n=1 Tax=Tilletia indica TaxID=43049 RepID=A0A177TLW9_9BASI|nr:hypothetical protein A4X13_0g6447 [Tilletia indica]
MVTRFALLQVVTLALMAQAAPVVRSPGDLAVELSTSAEETRASNPWSRGIEPWKWGVGAAAGAAALTELVEHLGNSDAPARTEGPERPAAPGPPGVPPPQAPPQRAPQGYDQQVYAPTPQYPPGYGQTPRPRVVQPVPVEWSLSSRGLLQGEDMETTRRGSEAGEGLGTAAGASKIPFKPMALGLVGGVALDHVLSSLPTPYFHSQPNFRSFDSNDNVVAAGIKRSELEPRALPWKWILGGGAGGLALDKLFID